MSAACVAETSSQPAGHPRPTASEARLEREALALELLDPRVRALLRLVVLVVLVAHEADELAVAHRLGLDVVVVVGRRHADDGRALLREAVVQLARRVAEVVAVALLVADAEDRDLLAREVHA